MIFYSWVNKITRRAFSRRCMRIKKTYTQRDGWCIVVGRKYPGRYFGAKVKNDVSVQGVIKILYRERGSVQKPKIRGKKNVYWDMCIISGDVPRVKFAYHISLDAGCFKWTCVDTIFNLSGLHCIILQHMTILFYNFFEYTKCDESCSAYKRRRHSLLVQEFSGTKIRRREEDIE